MTHRSYDVIVIGAGVAGLMAAGAAAETATMAGGRKAKILLVEKMEKPARKLRITGKGRCNITNVRERERFLEKVRSGREFVGPALEQFDNRALIEFFESHGLPLALERGERIFPESGRAWDVAEAMIKWVRGCGVEIVCNTPVGGLIIVDGTVKGVLTTAGETLNSERVILATGGVSYPATGSTGEGHRMAYDAGHNIVPLRPGLVPLVTPQAGKMPDLALRNVEVSLAINGTIVEKRFGEMEFNRIGITGPTVLQLSRTAVDAIADGARTELLIDLKAALDHNKLMARIDREIERLPTASLKVLLQKLTPSPLHSIIVRQGGLSINQPLSKMANEDKEALAGVLKSLRFAIQDYRPFTEAIITAGGVDLREVDPQTMQSLFIRGLYFAGELLDIDADTGGYNIQLACSTGHLAGVSARILNEIADGVSNVVSTQVSTPVSTPVLEAANDK